MNEKQSPARYTVRDPATGEDLATYKLMDASDVDAAVKRARAKFEIWRRSSFKERSRVLRRAASVLAEDSGLYARKIALENGKTEMDALLADVASVCEMLRYYARTAKGHLSPVRVKGNFLLPGRKGYYVFEPKGVVGVISPWNYPFTLSAGPSIAAVAAGNAVVLKPSEQTTESGLIFQEIMERAGLPQGVVEVVTGKGSVTGQALIENEGLDMLFFTGSTEIGRMVNLKAAERLIPAVMELGGKDVAVVTSNADLDRAAHGVVFGGFTNCGQTCIGTEIALVDRRVYEPFLKKVVALTNCLETGKKPGQVGSMTMRSQLEIVERQLQDALDKGARALTGGRAPEGKGMFFPPTILADTTADMLVRKEETFGPLLPIVPYDSIDEAVEMANSTEYGLSGAVFTRDMEEGRRIAARLKTGSVNINDVLVTYVMPTLPFGGMKKSGVGRYHSEVGIRAFTDVKSITEFSWALKKDPYWYPLPEEGDRVARDALVAVYSRNPVKRLAALARTAKMIRKMARDSKKECPG